MRSTLVAPLVIGLTVAPLPAHLRAWSPLLALGTPESTATAVVKIARLTTLADAITHGLEIEPATRARLRDVVGELGTLDPESLHGSMSPRSTGRRALSVHGELGDEGAYRVSGARALRTARFGDLDLAVALTRTPGETYLVETDVAAQLGLSADEVTGVAGGSIDWLRETAGVHRTVAGDGLDEADRAIGRGLHAAFPALAALVLRYVEPLDAVTGSGSGVRGRLEGRVRQAAFAADHPALAALLANVAVKARARVTTADGATLAVLESDSARGDAALVFDLDPARWRGEVLQAQLDVDAELLGMGLALSGLRVRTAVSRDRGLELRSVLDAVPSVRIHGAALGIVPVAVVDAVIPSDVQGLVDAFLAALARTDRTGASVIVGLPASEHEPIRLAARADLLHDDFVAFVLGIAAAEVFSDDDVLVELQRLQARGLAAFAADFARFREQTSSGG